MARPKPLLSVYDDSRRLTWYPVVSVRRGDRLKLVQGCASVTMHFQA